ncbi:hypothetical protein AOQ84DRAFT_357847 [Glonium stellatum]|uniref:NACHT-NTPase and P-loop NTPases N-terminal domain-containing protein n=1 Tax=Glonium stellatum TaxID=574774 RepID=A0A8E2EML5_9PEZI|nr:hypothetical protein AOQ84DRAFT_357847 [Glonium stellatum]
MSGVEAFGVLTGVFQLVDSGFKISQALRHVHKLVNGDPNLFQQQLDQINQLIYTAKLIKTSDIFQHGDITIPLKALIDETQQLQGILEEIISTASRKRGMSYLRAIVNSGRESRIRRAFTTLEEKKSTLTLCTLSTCSKLILQARDQIGEQVPLIRKSISDIESSFRQYPEILSEIHKVQKQLLQCRCMAASAISFPEEKHTPPCSSESSSSLFDSNKSTSRNLIVRSQGTLVGKKMLCSPTDQNPLQFGVVSLTEPIASTERPIQRNVPYPETAFGSPDTSSRTTNSRPGHRYHQVCATGSARQINGNIGCGHALSDPDLHYGRIIATGNSRQVNGNIFDPSFATAFFSN